MPGISLGITTTAREADTQYGDATGRERHVVMNGFTVVKGGTFDVKPSWTPMRESCSNRHLFND